MSYTYPCVGEKIVRVVELGNIEHGKKLYEEYACDACHGMLNASNSETVGPWLGNIAEEASTRIEGVSGWQYVYESILYPNDYIVPQCPNNQECHEPSLMPSDYSFRMSINPQDLIDLIAYLMNEPEPK